MSGPKSDAIVAEKKLITEPVKKITKPKVKKEKDPGAPERPPTAFVLFMEANFPDYKSIAVVAKEGGAKWNVMFESEKAPYVEKAAAKKAEYGIALKLHNVELAEAKEKSESTSKSPLEVHDDVEDVASSQVAKEGGAKWNAMSESEKAPYVEKAAAKKAEYRIALKLHNVELAEAKEKSESTSKSSLEVHDDVEDVASSQKFTKPKVKKEKDPGAPKRPPTAFVLFMEDFKENFADNKSIAVNNLLVSDVAANTKEHKLSHFFGGARVTLDYDPEGKYLRSATIFFADACSWQKGLLLSGKELDNRPIIISVIGDNGEKLPLYLKVENLAPQAKEAHVKKHFEDVTRTPVRVYIPMKKDVKAHWGFAFVYVCSIEALRACLALDNKVIGNRKARVLAGLYKGGRGRKREP